MTKRTALKKLVYETCKNFEPFKRAYVKRTIRKVTRQMFSEEEVAAAELDDERRRELVKNALFHWPEREKELNERIEQIFRATYAEQSDASLAEVREDMLFCFFAYGFSPNEYVSYELRDKTPQERKEFVSDRLSVCIGYRMNDFAQLGIYMDKMQTYERFKPYYGRKAVCIASDADYPGFLEFISNHPTFVKKQVNQFCGRSVELVDWARRDRAEQDVFRSILAEGKSILEEIVVQSDDIAQLNASSVNTIRCITLNTKSGIRIPYCFMKIGRKGSFIDNGGAGGILVGIDVSSGCLVTDGVDEMGRRYATHPDSGVTFHGLQLPEWEKMLEICRHISAQTPKVRFIGWDMAHTPKGWIVIEGNGLSELIGPQSTFLRGCKSELYGYMNDMDLII